MKFSGKEKLERLGKIKHDFNDCIWIHAASVGEVNAVKILILKLLNKYPKHNFVLSTMTKTGQKVAKEISPKLTTIFFPIDIYHLMRRVYRKLNPKLIFLVETEFWPNMLYLARKKKISAILLNGRISDKSFPKYRKMRFFWKPLWKTIVAVNAQSEKDAQRFISLNFKNVVNTHNLKFCLEIPEYDKITLRKELGFKESDFIIVWGSSRPGEEKLLNENLHKLNNQIKNLKLIIAPRHIHRSPEIKKIFEGNQVTFYSSLKSEKQIIIVDEMGILNMFYALSNLTIVGGSFFSFGGHNPLEPANYGMPIIMGKYHSSCQDSVNRLLENKAIVISDKRKIADDILKIYNDKKMAKLLGNNAKKTIKNNSKSLNENLKILQKYLL